MTCGLGGTERVMAVVGLCRPRMRGWVKEKSGCVRRCGTYAVRKAVGHDTASLVPQAAE